MRDALAVDPARRANLAAAEEIMMEIILANYFVTVPFTALTLFKKTLRQKTKEKRGKLANARKNPFSSLSSLLRSCWSGRRRQAADRR
jgi:hypothetical protein